MARSKNIGDAIRKKLAKNPDLAEGVESARFSFNVASEVHRVRTELKLTQKGLADLLGTQQSVVARLEDADYDGHSVKLLRRIAEATGKRLEVRFVDDVPQPKVAAIEIVEEQVPWLEAASEWDDLVIEDCSEEPALTLATTAP